MAGTLGATQCTALAGSLALRPAGVRTKGSDGALWRLPRGGVRAQAEAPLGDGPSQVARRPAMAASLALLAGLALSKPEEAEAVSSARAAMRAKAIREEDYKEGRDGLKYYDVVIGNGAVAKRKDRVAIHYDAKWKGVTFMTSRQGAGVTGGTPYGFDVGASEDGLVLKGLDYGVEGMRVGGQRKLILPPNLAYGSRGIQEIPPNATLEVDIELLSIKQSAFGSRVKIVEG